MRREKGTGPGRCPRYLPYPFPTRVFRSAFDAEREAIGVSRTSLGCYVRGARAHPQSGSEFADPITICRRMAGKPRCVARRRGTSKDMDGASRVLLIIGAARNDGTCRAKSPKAFVLPMRRGDFPQRGLDVDRLDLSLLSSITAKIIPANPAFRQRCRLPLACTCYPNMRLANRTIGWPKSMNAGFAAHGIMIVTPVYWDKRRGLKLMMDRMVCADGGNRTDLDSRQEPEEAKRLSLPMGFQTSRGTRLWGRGAWRCGRHRRGSPALCEWLDGTALIDAER